MATDVQAQAVALRRRIRASSVVVPAIGLTPRRARPRLARHQPGEGLGPVLPDLPDRADERRALRPRRARLHARLRHPRADQLRPRRRLHDRRDGHGDRRAQHVQPAGGPGSRDARSGDPRRAPPRDGRLRFPERDDRARRVQATSARSAPCAAHHGDRGVVHPPERRPDLEGLRAGRDAAVAPGRRDLHGRDLPGLRRLHVEPPLPDPHNRAGPRRPRLARRATRGAGRRCAPPRRTRTRRR